MIGVAHREEAAPANENEGGAYAEQPQLAVAALLHLLSRFPATRKTAVARAIVHHLRIVADDARLDPALRDCAGDLIPGWQAFAALSSGDPAPPSQLSRH